MGIYWTMKYDNRKDTELLKEWELEGKGLDIQLYVPTGYYDKFKKRGIPVDSAFAIKLLSSFCLLKISWSNCSL